MASKLVVCVIGLAVLSARAGDLMPTAPGTAWQYEARVPGVSFAQEIRTDRPQNRRPLGAITAQLKPVSEGATPPTPSGAPPVRTTSPPLTPTPTPTSTPRVTPTPISSSVLTPPAQLARKLSLEISDRPNGEPKQEISSAVVNIFARWRGRGLGERAKVRVVWIAENVGDIAPPNYEIDDASTIVSGDAHGAFTLSRPIDGWAPGAYRVNLYVNGTLAASVHLRILK